MNNRLYVNELPRRNESDKLRHRLFPGYAFSIQRKNICGNNSKLLAKGVSVTDAEVGAAVAFAYRELKLVVEPGGAVGLAALLAGRIDARDKNIVIVLSGGNVDAELFAKLVA